MYTEQTHTLLSAILLSAVAFISTAGARSASGQMRDTPVGIDALPGFHRVPYLTDRRLLGVGTAGLGWGVTESIGPVAGAHHQVAGRTGLGVVFLNHGAVSLTLNGRYDIHPDDNDGKDRSGLLEPAVSMRGHITPSPRLRLGLGTAIRIPAEDGISLAVGNAAFDFDLLLSYETRSGKFRVGGLAGFRLDRSGETVSSPSTLRSGDWLSLGLSDYNAVLLGIAGALQLKKWSLASELTADIFVGDGAPIRNAPVRWSMAADVPLSRRLQAGVRTETLLVSRPEITQTAPLIPIEPRFTILVSLSLLLSIQSKPTHVAPAAPPKPTTVAPLPPVKEKTTPPTGSIRGWLADDEENPIIGATVTLTAGALVLQSTTDTSGQYVFEGVPLGPAVLETNTEDFENNSWTVTVESGKPKEIQPRILQFVLPGSQLKGQIRSYEGAGISATVRILPLNVELPADEHGKFVVDLAPGTYRITIEKDGYISQTQSITVEEHGVAIANVELRRKKGSP